MNDRERRRVLQTRNLTLEDDGGVLVSAGSPAPRPKPMLDTVISGAVLTVRERVDGAERTFDVTLDERPHKFGRTPHGGPGGPNDIVLSAPFVSRDQARIEPDGMGHRVVALGAPNQLAIDGVPIALPYALRDGDVLELTHGHSSDAVSFTYRNPMLALAQPAPEFRSYALDARQARVAIGRQDCAVLLKHPAVSRVHAWLDRLPEGGHLLRDAGSANGTFVNGQRVVQHALTAGDTIQIGPFKLIYQPGRLEQHGGRQGLRIDVRNLTHAVGAGARRKTILQPLSLSVEPREFVAIVGGSGAGKSTLMRAISGYTHASGGQVQVDGDDFYRNFDAYRALVGYVPQDDILHQTLQVDRALGYAARLRLGADTDEAEIRQRVEQALAEVEMLPHRAKNVESLSGGQRKRVSIAAELLADPNLFFLDEPTSGLDPGLEKKMMQTLRQLADGGRTVMLVTHATENIALCDHVVFMAAGRMVFFGPPSEALRFFGVTSGLFSEIYTRLEGPASASDTLVQAQLAEAYATWRQSAPEGVEPTLAELWEIKYRASATYGRYVADRLAKAEPTLASQAAPAERRQRPPRPSALRQFGLLTRRYFELTLRDRVNLLILLLQAPIIAVMNLILLRSDVITGVTGADLVPRIQAQSFLFFLGPIGIWFGVINAAREITKEQAIYARERMSNLALVPYIASKVAVMSLLVLIQNAALLGVVALKVDFAGLQGVSLAMFPELYISMVLASLAGMALGLIISSLSKTSDQAISMVPLALVPQILFTGLIFPLEQGSLPEAISRIMISRWAVDALGTSVNINRFCHLPNGSPLAANCSPPAADVFPSAFLHTWDHLSYTWLILLAFVAAGVAITGLLLKLKERRAR